MPSALSQLIWDPTSGAANDAQPANATEAALRPLVDDKQRVRSVNCVSKFVQVFIHAKTESDQALVLIVLRASATASDSKLAKACTSAFEKLGGLKIAKKWLNEAVEWNYSDLLVLLLDVLKVLPVQLNSITEARINEPIVSLRKTAQEEKVRRAAQDLLKHWRSRFTEKEKEKSKPSVAAPVAPAANGGSKATASTSTPVSSTVTTTKVVSDPVAAEAKPLKKRPIKRLERMPFGGGSSSAATSSKSSGLIGNLMQRKTAKDAAATSSTKPKKEPSEASESPTSSKPASSPVTSTQTSPKNEIALQLPAIQSFKAVSTCGSVSKKIRWADEEGKDLCKIKLIESWRDMVHHQPHDENTFKDAKLREHELERQAMKSHKEREAFQLTLVHEWSTPALMRMPEALVARRAPVSTEEVETQSARTRREMEFLVLDGEVPPVSPKEWTRGNEPHRGAPKEIPLLDVDAAAATTSGAPPPAGSFGEPPETQEERALREALGPLQRSTIALLMDNEHVLPIVYEEAQRNGNRIPDGRVMEIVQYHSRRAPHQNQPPYGQHQGPPPNQRHNAPPHGYDGGFNKYGGNGYNGPPQPDMGGPPPPGPNAYDYGRQYGGPPQGPPQPMHHMGHKRKAPGGGILADGPPAKRPVKRGPNGVPLPCMYFMGPSGCRHGNNCQFSHEVIGGPPPGLMGAPPDFGNGYGPPHGGGRFGHQPPIGMRGGGPRGMRGGR